MDRNRSLWHAAVSGGLYFGVGLTIMIFTYQAARKADLRAQESINELEKVRDIFKPNDSRKKLKGESA